MLEHRRWIGLPVLCAGWIAACSGSDGTSIGVNPGADGGGQAGAAAADSGTGTAGGNATTGGTGGTTAAGGSSGSGTAAQGGDNGTAAAAGAGAGIDSGGQAAGLGGRDQGGAGDTGVAGSAGTGGPGAGGTAGTVGSGGSAGIPLAGGTAGVSGGIGQGGDAGSPAGVGGSTNVGGTVGVGGVAPVGGAGGAAGAPNPITITPPGPLTDDCYLSLNPGDSLDLATLVAGSGTGTPQVSLAATTERVVGDLATITGTVVDFAAEASDAGYHAFEFLVYDATGSDRLMIVIDYTSASQNPAGAALYSDVDAASGALGTPVPGPILMTGGETASTFWDIVDGDQHCCMDATNQLHCGSCIYDSVGMRGSWAGMLFTNERCTDCAAGELCVSGSGCVAEDPTESANCVTLGTGTHYLNGLGCVYPVVHVGNPYFMTTGTAAPGAVAATMGRQLDVTAPPISGRCGFVAVSYEVAASPPYFADPPCDGTSPTPSLCQEEYEAGNTAQFTAVYIVQPQ